MALRAIGGLSPINEIHNRSACLENLIGRRSRQEERLTAPSSYEAGSQGGEDYCARRAPSIGKRSLFAVM